VFHAGLWLEGQAGGGNDVFCVGWHETRDDTGEVLASQRGGGVGGSPGPDVERLKMALKRHGRGSIPSATGLSDKRRIGGGGPRGISDRSHAGVKEWLTDANASRVLVDFLRFVRVFAVVFSGHVQATGIHPRWPAYETRERTPMPEIVQGFIGEPLQRPHPHIAGTAASPHSASPAQAGPNVR
jgi:hypothetical protein